MTKPTGGRGIKAPYATKIIRVPEPCVEQVTAIIEAFREGDSTQVEKPVTGYESIRDDIDEWRKSSKVGKAKLENLLQLIYGVDFKL
jgi:hypothetical protein